MKTPVLVKVKKGIIELVEEQDGLVSVRMGAPRLNWSDIVFDDNHSTKI